MQPFVKILALLLVLLSIALILPGTAEYGQYLAIASLVVAVALLLTCLAGAAPAAPSGKAPVAEAVKPPPPAASGNQAQTELITLLGVFQEKGRFVDFLMEDITPFNDAEVGAVARSVHQGCRAALKEHFQIEPISKEPEGAPITVPAGYAADEFRLVGNLTGEAPFEGKVVHKGWRATSVKIPRALHSDKGRLPAIAPAQVEI